MHGLHLHHLRRPFGIQAVAAAALVGPAVA
jgi:hypothetical protein